MLSVVVIHSSQSGSIVFSIFSRLVSSIKTILFHGPPLSKFNHQKTIFIRMGERRNHEKRQQNTLNSFNSYTSIPTSVPNHQPGFEESIFVDQSVGNYAYVYNTCGLPYWQPMQPLTPAAFQPNLWPHYFHRQFNNLGNQAACFENKSSDRAISEIRFWEKLSEDKNPGVNFSLMSYNVLAQDLVDQHMYLYDKHNKDSLGWDIRWKNLLKEIKKFQPDILCMQEVQNSHLELNFSALEAMGYRGLYKRRTGIRTDGCAIYYKQSMFNLIEYTTVEYNQPDVRILNRDNVGIIAKFAPKSNPNNNFVVATTHLLYNPKREDVRLAQILLLLTELDRISYVKDGKYLPVILTGDLNSTPDSSVYKFINNGSLKYENLALRQVGGTKQKLGRNFLPSYLRITDQCQHADLLAKREKNISLSRTQELELIELKHSERKVSSNKKPDIESTNRTLFASGTLSHRFALKSVYNHMRNNDIEATTHQNEWLTVDYIFYSNPRSKRQLKLLERYALPTKSELGNIKIPNTKLGSDHLCLIAKFKLRI